MRNVAVCGSLISHVFPHNNSFTTIDMHGVPVTFGVLETKEPAFDGNTPAHADKVLVRITAFSCNYRDKSLMLKMATKGPPTGFYNVALASLDQVTGTLQHADLSPNSTQK